MSVNISVSQFQHKELCTRCGTRSQDINLEYSERGKCSSCISLSDEQAQIKKETKFKKGEIKCIILKG